MELSGTERNQIVGGGPAWRVFVWASSVAAGSSWTVDPAAGAVLSPTALDVSGSVELLAGQDRQADEHGFRGWFWWGVDGVGVGWFAGGVHVGSPG